MKIPILITTRLSLRPLDKKDISKLFQILQEPGILRYFPNPSPPSLEKARNIIQEQLTQYEKFGLGEWGVEETGTGELLGWCGINHLSETNEFEIAYLLKESARGQGFAIEAARTSLQYGFKSLGIHQIIALVHPYNTVSQRVINKLGMKFLEKKTYWGMECLKFHTIREWATDLPPIKILRR